jgi:hypothetical protein
MSKGFLIFEEMRIYLTKDEEATAPFRISLYMRKIRFFYQYANLLNDNTYLVILRGGEDPAGQPGHAGGHSVAAAHLLQPLHLCADSLRGCQQPQPADVSRLPRRVYAIPQEKQMSFVYFLSVVWCPPPTVKRVDGKLRQPDRMTQYSSIRVTEHFFNMLIKLIRRVPTKKMEYFEGIGTRQNIPTIFRQLSDHFPSTFRPFSVNFPT